MLLKSKSAVSYHMFAMWIQFCSNYGCAIRMGITNTLVRVLLKSHCGYSYHMVAVWIQFGSGSGSASRIVIISTLLRILMKSLSAVSYRMFAVWIQFSSYSGCAIRIKITNTILRLLLKSKCADFYLILAFLNLQSLVISQCTCPCPRCAHFHWMILFTQKLITIMRSWKILIGIVWTYEFLSVVLSDREFLCAETCKEGDFPE